MYLSWFYSFWVNCLLSLFVKHAIFFQVLEKDFHPETPAAQLKLMQIKELNKVLEGLRANIKVMGMDPIKLKEESETFKREAKLRRMERALLLARLDEKQKIDETNEGANVDDINDDDDMHFEDVKLVQPEQVEASGFVVSDQIVVDNEVVVDAPPHQHQEVDGANDPNEEQAIGCRVPFEDFQLFLKFQKFLKAERQVNEVTVPIVQPIQDSSTEASVVSSQKKSFITLPDGRVIEILDVGNVV